MLDIRPSSRSKLKSRRARPTIEGLEDRRLLTDNSVSLNGIFGISAYTNVKFERNLVAELTGIQNGQRDLNVGDYTARINWGDGAQSNGELTLDGTGSFFVVKGSHKYATANNDYHITVHATGPAGSTADRETAEADVQDLPAGLSRAVDPTRSYVSGDPRDVSLNLSGIFGVSSYTNVGFDRNLVADLTGLVDGQRDLNPDDYHAQINWGDDGHWSPAEIALDGTGSFLVVKGSHVYKQAKSDDHIVVLASGPDGTTTIRETAEATVEDIPAGLSRTVAPPQSYISGDPRDVSLNLSGIFGVSGLADRPLDASNNLVAELTGLKDGQRDLKPGDYHAQINWGDDGKWSPATLSLDRSGSVLLVRGSHVYKDPKTDYHIVVHAAGPDGTTTTRETAEANIGPEPPCVFKLKPIKALLTGTAGTPLKGELATFVLPDPGDSVGLTTQIKWGDGSITDSTPTPVPAAAIAPASAPLQGSASTYEIALNHDYKKPGTYTIALEVNDSDGCEGRVEIPVQIKKQTKPPSQLPDIVAKSLVWDAKQGGADFTYRVDAAPLPAKTTVELEWVKVSGGRAQVLSRPLYYVFTERAIRLYGPFHATTSNLGTPPAGTTHLRLLADPANLIRESNENNNALLIPLKTRPRPTATLESINFTSDQAEGGRHLLYRNKTNYTFNAGINKPYPNVEWRRDPKTGKVIVNAPFTQALTTPRVKALVTLKVVGGVNGTPYRLVGTSADPAFRFSQSGRLVLNPTTDMIAVPVTGQSTLGKKLRIINQSITWTLTLNPGTSKQEVISLGASGPHKLYTTFGPPVDDDLAHPWNVLTDKRVERAVIETAKAIPASTNAEPSPPRLVFNMVNVIYQEVGGYNLSNSLANKGENYWTVPDQRGGLDCISLSTFVGWDFKMVGVPGTINAKTYAPNVFNVNPRDLTPDTFLVRHPQYKEAVWGSLRNPLGPLPPGANPNQFRRILSPDNFALALWDGNHNANFFEATVVFVWGGHTYYFPGGVPRAVFIDDVNKILTTFQSLGWGGVQAGRLVEVQTLTTYSPAPNDLGRLPR